jgi:hypothetical protein
MGLGDLFKSEKERERDRQKKRRKAFREAENAVDAVKERVAKVKKERDRFWAEARQYLKDGQKAAAQRGLQSCRAAEVMVAKLETKRWVFEQLLVKLELAKTDQEFAKSLQAIDAVVEIDPDSVADVLGAVEDKLGEQADVDKIWERAHEKEMEGVSSKMADVIPSVEEMEKQLQDEVAVEIGKGPATGKNTGLSERIGEGQERIRKILEDGK